jgi:RHS repeat-associated protein
MKTRLTASLAAVLFSLAFLHGHLLRAQTASGEPDADPTGNAGVLKANVTTGGGYDAHTGNASRSVTDLQVPGVPGDYGLDFTRHWNSISSGPNLTNGGWSSSWDWSATYDTEDIMLVDGGPETLVTYITVNFPDGRAIKYFVSRGTDHQQYAHYGPPYSATEVNWSATGVVTDHLCNMAADGSNFWLYRSDGGSVHFEGGPWSYRATEIFDPHGLRTTLHYDGTRVDRVTAPNGRFLSLEYQDRVLTTTPYMAISVLSAVQTGGSAGTQRVEYDYGSYPMSQGSMQVTAWALIDVRYVDDLGTGQDTHATYRYENMTDSTSGLLVGPVLTYADDPHFDGPMTKIKYSYRGGSCGVPFPAPNESYPDARFDRFYAPATSITAEMSGDHVDQFGQPIVVSSLSLSCYDGYRTESKGSGGSRKLYFGRSAGAEPGAQYSGSAQSGYWNPPEAGVGNYQGYHLTKVTDFSADPDHAPFEFQHYSNDYPWRIFDGNRNITQLAMLLDGSAHVAEVWHRGDNSKHTYNWTNPGASSARDTSVIPNTLNHWLFSQTDVDRGLTTTYTRDERRRITRIDYPDAAGSYETFSYENNALNEVASHRLPSGAVEHYEYDGQGLLQRAWNSVDGEGAAKVYTYDEHGRVKTMQDGRARSAGAAFSVQMTYNGRNQITSVEYPATDGVQHPTASYEYDAYGNCTSITDELGHTRHYTYDSYRRCTSYTEPLSAQTSRTWNWYYDRYMDGFSIDAAAHTSKQWRVQVEPAHNTDGERRLSARFFDYNDRIITEYTGMFEKTNGSWNSGPDTEVHSFQYDANGNKSRYTDPRGRVTDYTYDNRNRLKQTIEPLTRITENFYDTVGNKTDVTFPDTRSQHWRDYDPFGQAWTFIDERNNTTNLTYWWGPMKKLRTVTTHRDKDDEGTEDQETTFMNDGMGRPLQTLFPDHSHEDTSYECTDAVTYSCDQVHKWTTRKGQTKTIVYDARGRETSHTWNDGQTSGITRVWDAASRMTSIANLLSTIDYAYDEASQPLSESNTIAGAGGAALTTYNRYPNGDVARIGYPGGFPLHKDYTARGQLKTVSIDGGGFASFVDYTYNADGKVAHEDFASDGKSADFGYDYRGFVTSVLHKKSATGQTVSSRTYTRDTRDRITSWARGTDATINPMENGRGNRYAYDAEGQLVEAWYNATNPSVSGAGNTRYDRFNHDALGNRAGSNYVANYGLMTFTRKDNGLNQYRSWTPSVINYDDDIGLPWGTPEHANGVLMQEGWVTAGFNALNQPMYIWTPNAGWSNFGYDPLGRCVKRSSDLTPPTYLYYDGWNLIQEGPGATIPDRIYIHGGRIDQILCSYQYSTGAAYNFYYDALGHCILATNSYTGTIVEQYDYDAFGKPYFYDASGSLLSNGSAIGTRFLFTGREYLSDLKLYDYRNRLYQPELGRFLQPDPKQFAAGDYNLYRYAHNDPINHFDPFGLLTWRYEKGFPETGPGGKKAIERAIKNELSRTKKGQEILAAEGVVTIRRVTATHGIGTDYYRNPNEKNFTTYLDPTNSRFQDPATFKALWRHPGELPEDSDKGRAVIIGHEFSHGVFKMDDEHLGGRNIRDNENAIRDQLGLPLRRSEGDLQFRTNE